MYTTLITAGILAFVFLCMFKKRWDNSNEWNDSNFKVTVIAIFVGVVIAAQTVVTVVRLDSLPIKTAPYCHYVATAQVVKVDSISYKIDTITNGKSTTITKTKVDKSKRNAVVLHKHWLSIKYEDGGYKLYDKEKDETRDLSGVNLIVSDTIKNTVLYKVATEYVSDDWVTVLIPTIKSWEELHLSTKEYNKILKYYPEFVKLKK